MEGYDIAQICLNGHITNDSAQRYPNHNRSFCPDCGEKTIMKCPSCQASILGDYYVDGFTGTSVLQNSPAFCHNCGKGYPWTENKIRTAIQIFAEFGNLNEDENKTIEDDIKNVARNVPQAELSALRIKKIWNKYGKIAYNVIMEFASKTTAEILKSQ